MLPFRAFLVWMLAVGLTGCTTAPPVPGVASGLAETTRLSYVATGRQGTISLGGVSAEVNWLRAASTYEARLRWFFLYKTLRDQQSFGQIDSTGLMPDSFSEVRRKQEAQARFDRAHGLVSFSVGTPSAPLRPGAQDRLSVVFQMGALLAANPARHPTGSSLEFQVVGLKAAETWVFNIDAEGTHDVPAGRFATRKAVRLPQTELDDKIEIWFATELHHLPIRIRQTMADGDFVDMALQDRHYSPSPE